MGKILEIFKAAGMEPTPEMVGLIEDEDGSVAIPRKVLAKLQYIPMKDWKTVHEDTQAAKELTLIILSNLSNTWSIAQHTDNLKKKQGYKRLHSVILRKQVTYSHSKTAPYKAILELLIKHGIVEKGRNGFHTPDGKGKATEYRLTRSFFGKGIERYKLKTTLVKRMKNKEMEGNFDRLLKTAIGKNAIMFRLKCRFPTEEEVIKKLNQAVKDKYTNRKGKRLVNLGKHSKTEYPESDFVYAEDYLERFRYLRDHLSVPIIREEYIDHNGQLVFRVATAFNLMPSLLRDMITVGGDKLVENDFSCLHPNIVQMVYGGENKEPITHEKVAEFLGISRQEAKIEHLSFFNKRVGDMKRSPLWEYYDTQEPLMMERIIKEKKEYGHEETCKVLFKYETIMMEEVTSKLLELGIDSVYVYDCLYCIPQEQSKVKELMNETAKKYNIKTTVK